MKTSTHIYSRLTSKTRTNLQYDQYNYAKRTKSILSYVHLLHLLKIRAKDFI